MSFDVKKVIQDNLGKNNQLHSDYINPQFAKVLKTIGFDKSYTKAHGPYLYDKDGKEYLDFLSGYGVYAMGRNHPRMKEVLKEYLDLDEANLIQMEAPLMSGLLAEKLVKMMPDPELNTIFFTNSGTEANEAAIKYARAATGRERIIYMDHAFHGLSTGSLSLNGGTEFQKGFGQLLPSVKIPFNDLAALEKELKQKDCAAFFFEPIQGKGVYVPTDDFLPEAEKLCRKYGTLLVADEVQTGLGRTGKWLAHTHWNVKPDIITIAKALSGGMVPVGATICKRWIYDKVFSKMERCVVHSSTFGQ
ncbi:aspartate aminotransferase family protein, partial [bacterium]|nr:aspartate aminotransferase family protein [bacterium]